MPALRWVGVGAAVSEVRVGDVVRFGGQEWVVQVAVPSRVWFGPLLLVLSADDGARVTAFPSEVELVGSQGGLFEGGE